MLKPSKISLGIIVSIFLIFAFNFILINSVCAETPSTGETPSISETPSKSVKTGSQGLVNPLGTNSIEEVFARVIKGFLSIVGIAALLAFIIGGFQWLTSGGNPERIKLGRNTMMWAALGVLLAFSAYAFISYLITALTTPVG